MKYWACKGQRWGEFGIDAEFGREMEKGWTTEAGESMG